MRVTIYCKGAPLLSSEGKCIADSCTDRIHDTTKNVDLPVLLKTKKVGSAMSLEKVTLAGVAMLRYEVNLIAAVDIASLEKVADGFAGSISGTMWLHGLYPTKIQLA